MNIRCSYFHSLVSRNHSLTHSFITVSIADSWILLIMQVSLALSVLLLSISVSVCSSSETPSARSAANLPLVPPLPVPFVISPGSVSDSSSSASASASVLSESTLSTHSDRYVPRQMIFVCSFIYSSVHLFVRLFVCSIQVP
jgi:hypothetical protein